MVTAAVSAAPRAVAWDVVFSMLDELRTSHDVVIDAHGITVTDRVHGATYSYLGSLAGAIQRAWAGEPPDVR